MRRVKNCAAQSLTGRKSAATTTLKIVCALAIWRGTSGAVRATRSANGAMKGKKSATPTTLNAACAAATRRASAFCPTAARSAVTAGPQFAAGMIGEAAGGGGVPPLARGRAEPVVARAQAGTAGEARGGEGGRGGGRGRAPR